MRAFRLPRPPLTQMVVPSIGFVRYEVTMARRGVPINRFISQEAMDGWQDWCDEHGVTLTSVLDVIGRQLGAGWKPSKAAVTMIVGEARRRDAEQRRSR